MGNQSAILSPARNLIGWQYYTLGHRPNGSSSYAVRYIFDSRQTVWPANSARKYSITGHFIRLFTGNLFARGNFTGLEFCHTPVTLVF